MHCTIDYTTYKDVIVIRDFKQNVTAECLVYSWNYMIDNKLLTPDVKGVISDFRHCEITFSISDIQILVDFFIKHDSYIGKLKLAQVVDTPDIVYALLFHMKNPDYKSMAFSTIEAAKYWITS